MEAHEWNSFGARALVYVKVTGSERWILVQPYCSQVAFERALGENTRAVENRGEVRDRDESLWEPLLSLLLCCSSSSRASSPNAGTKEIQEKFASSQDAFDDVVKYFGENPKTTPPSVFFPVFVRFVKAYKVIRSRGSFKASPGIIFVFKHVPF